MTNEEREALIAQGWTPPVAVDPDLAEAITLAKGLGLAHYIPVLEGIKRGRELERAEADTEIDQLQETILSITEPIQAPETGEYMLYGAPHKVGVTKLKLKDTAKVKPGMVWVKHDGSRQSPVPGALVTVSLGQSHYQTGQSFMIDWWRVSHYAIISQPEDAV